MKHLTIAALLFAGGGLAGVASASPPDKMDPTGTWTWTIDANGQIGVTTLQLRLEGDKLTGVLIAPDGRQTPLEDAKYEHGVISFKVAGKKSTSKNFYSGTLKGDTIKGYRKFDVGSQGFTFRRVKER